MFCPKCSSYLREDDLIKKNTKFAPGNVAIEYDARCPNCSVEMGKVFWGKLSVNPDIVSVNSAPVIERKPLLSGQKEKPFSDAAPSNTVQDNSANAQSATKACPHCGKELPLDF